MHSELFIIKQSHIINVYYILIMSLFFVSAALSFLVKTIAKYKVVLSTLFLFSALPLLLILTSPENFIMIDTYSVFFSSGYALASILLYIFAKNVGVDTYKLLFFYISVFAASIIGARLFFALFEYSTIQYPAPLAFFRNPLVLIDKHAGFVIYGGLILGSIAGYIHLKLSSLPISKVTDICSFSIFYGIFLGRLGCFFNGCCFGRKSSYSSFFTLKWTSFKPYTGAYDYHYSQGCGVYQIFNTQIISSVFALAAGLIFFYLYKKQEKLRGYLFLLAAALYALFRFLIEFLRADNPAILFNLTLSQLISMAVFAFSLFAVICRQRRKMRERV